MQRAGRNAYVDVLEVLEERASCAAGHGALAQAFEFAAQLVGGAARAVLPRGAVQLRYDTHRELITDLLVLVFVLNALLHISGMCEL